MDSVFSFIALFFSIFVAYGGFSFFAFIIHDLFCPIGNEYLFVSDLWVKDKKNFRWNRKK